MQVIVDRLAIEYTDQGAGPVILMLHGWLDSQRSFEGLAAGLRSDHRVVCLDFPGFGGSQPPPADWDVGDFVVFTQHFLEKLALRPAIIIGHSFGGRVAIKGLGTGQLTAEKLILIGSAGVGDRQRNRRPLYYRLAVKIGKALGRLPFLRPFYQKQRQRLYARLGSDYLESGKLQGSFCKVVAEDLSALAAKLKLPTLLVWGERDTSTPLAAGQKLHRLITGSRLEVIAGAGHFVHRESPAAVLSLIRAFL